MGNEQGSLGRSGTGGGAAPESPGKAFDRQFNLFNKKPLITLAGLGAKREGKDSGSDGGDGGAGAAAGQQQQHEAANQRLQRSGDIQIGDSFVTWLSSALTDVAYLEGTVVDVFEVSVGTPLYGHDSTTSRRSRGGRGGAERKKKYVVLKYDNGRTAELDIPGLKASIARAQQAVVAEKEWMERIRALGLVVGETTELWVSRRHSATSSQRRRSQMLQNIGAYVAHVDDRPGGIGMGSGGGGASLARRSASYLEEPGSIATFKLLQINIGWHFQAPVVLLELAPVTASGALGDLVETLPFDAVRRMLEDARAAKDLLQHELDQIREHEGIQPEAKVDLWITELDTNVRGVIVEIGGTFQSLSKVELQPTVKYFLQGKKYLKHFDTYVDFVTSWKQAKYVAEQQFMLTQEAFEKGVRRGAQVSVYQEPHSARWQLKEGGALDAVVEALIFDFNPSKYLVSMHVRLGYGHISGKDASVKRRLSTRAGPLATETLPWEELLPRLRCKVVVSNITCQDLIERGTADPFVKLVVGMSKRKTPFLEDDPSPSWEGLEYVFREDEDRNRNKAVATYKAVAHVLAGEARPNHASYFDQNLHIVVYNHNKLSRRSFMGEATIELADLVPTGCKEYTVTLGPENRKSPKHDSYGRINLTITAVGPGVTGSTARVFRQSTGNELERLARQTDGKALFMEAFS